ncbi:hypothetical protein BU17DRAFT_46151 [Hysterangium stoloniferum]|nr:hypothetical protein BU17DRAFT_46151 [Hysterangium stoloniferum]
MSSLATQNRVKSIYKEVWKEYFDWEQDYCKGILSNLAPSSSGTSSAPLAAQLPRFDLNDENQPSSISYGSYQLSLIAIDGKEDPAPQEIQYGCPTYRFPTISPAKPYEACTYSHKNLYVADDFCEKLPFMPFSDSSNFPAGEFLELYDAIGWMNRKDPDLDMIAAEAVRRLHFSHGLSYEEIDATGILPVTILERPDKKGILHTLNQRDVLSWPGSTVSNLPPLPRIENPPPTQLKKRVNGIRYLLCANLNCLEPYCPTHCNLFSQSYSHSVNMDEQIKFISSSKINGDFEESDLSPCGPDCYKHLADHTEGLAVWDDEMSEDFKFMLEGASELSSCDLAVVCDKPCREVYTHRQQYAPKPSDDNGGAAVVENDEASDSDSESSEDERPIFGMSEICQHLGKCDALADCRCYRKQLHCHRNCRCDLSCVRRPKGCRCKNTGRRMCRTPKCSCFKAGRECDPELCQKCGANALNKCHNNDIQHGRTKAMEVKEGAFGLGLFLTESAKEGDLIGEYIGEILSDKMTEARGLQSRHLGRNYLFALNAEWTIDAALVGNETRFINHAPGNLANCRAEVREVNGDHRIGTLLIVKRGLQAGDELFMDYGGEYFTTGGKGATPRAGGKR